MDPEGAPPTYGDSFAKLQEVNDNEKEKGSGDGDISPLASPLGEALPLPPTTRTPPTEPAKRAPVRRSTSNPRGRDRAGRDVTEDKKGKNELEEKPEFSVIQTKFEEQERRLQ